MDDSASNDSSDGNRTFLVDCLRNIVTLEVRINLNILPPIIGDKGNGGAQQRPPQRSGNHHPPYDGECLNFHHNVIADIFRSIALAMKIGSSQW